MSYNLYNYGGNNPIVNVDITGNLVIPLIIGLKIAKEYNSYKKRKKAFKEIKKAQSQSDKVPDKTDEFDKVLESNAKRVKKETKNKWFIQKLKYIKNTACDGCEFDLKLTDQWDEAILYNGVVLEPQDIGNLHFGYVGRAAGIPLSVLKIGAGVNQLSKYGDKTISNCFSDSYCDDMRDTYYIEVGAMLYDLKH